MKKLTRIGVGPAGALGFLLTLTKPLRKRVGEKWGERARDDPCYPLEQSDREVGARGRIFTCY